MSLYQQAANKLNEANGINGLDAQEKTYTEDELLAVLNLLKPPENFTEQQWRVYKSNLRKAIAKVIANREISSKVKELVGPEGIAEDAMVAHIARENMEKKLHEVYGMLKLFPAISDLDNVTSASAAAAASTCDKQGRMAMYLMTICCSYGLNWLTFACMDAADTVLYWYGSFRQVVVLSVFSYGNLRDESQGIWVEVYVEESQRHYQEYIRCDNELDYYYSCDSNDDAFDDNELNYYSSDSNDDALVNDDDDQSWLPNKGSSSKVIPKESLLAAQMEDLR
nr:probable E3 ubiquitin-protein ligase ARI2 [Tanacetum cinerariifolium]